VLQAVGRLKPRFCGLEIRLIFQTRIHDVMKYQCSCGMSFNSEDELKKHAREKHQAGPQSAPKK
jgi:nucleotidyltransferase/DNA polymerase involved in DNA repair